MQKLPRSRPSVARRLSCCFRSVLTGDPEGYERDLEFPYARTFESWERAVPAYRPRP